MIETLRDSLGYSPACAINRNDNSSTLQTLDVDSSSLAFKEPHKVSSSEAFECSLISLNLVSFESDFLLLDAGNASVRFLLGIERQIGWKKTCAQVALL